MLADRLRLRFSLKSLFVLFLGIAIGFSLNMPLRQFLVRFLQRPTAPQPYVIEPPDVLRIDVFDPSSGNLQPVSNVYSVAPNGQVYLDEWGAVYVAGMTINEAHAAIEKAIGKHVRSAKVVLDIVATESKSLYIITKLPAGHDNVQRLKATGSDTVLDAITRAGGIVNPNSTQVWISRPPGNGVGTVNILPVDWAKVVSRNPTATNYRLYAGDRVYVSPTTLPAAAQ